MTTRYVRSPSGAAAAEPLSRPFLHSRGQADQAADDDGTRMHNLFFILKIFLIFFWRENLFNFEIKLLWNLFLTSEPFAHVKQIDVTTQYFHTGLVGVKTIFGHAAR